MSNAKHDTRNEHLPMNAEELYSYKNVYIYSKEIRRLVIASNNATVVK
jgi:hypothetical protein